MRIIVIGVMAIASALLFCSCDSIDTPPSNSRGGKGYQAHILLLDSATIENAGSIHNTGLAYMRSAYDYGKTFASVHDRSVYILSLAAGFMHDEGGFDSSSINTAPNQSALADMLTRSSPHVDAEVREGIKSDAAFAENVSTTDIAIIDSAMAVFSLPTAGLTNTQIANRIIAKASNLISQLPSNSSFGREVAGGLLYVMKGSASHWRDNPVTTTECPGNPPDLGQIVQLDCVGYIVGWYTAVAAELGMNGHLDVNNQARRIAAGGAGAVSWSFGGPLRKLLGLGGG